MRRRGGPSSSDARGSLQEGEGADRALERARFDSVGDRRPSADVSALGSAERAAPRADSVQRVGDVEVRRLGGPALQSALGDLAALRIAVFRDYPYLYDGDLAYERKYLASYAAAEGAVVVGAFDGARMIGAATGAPMAGEKAAWTKPFKDAGVDLGAVFYCGESVLDPGYRGRGIGHAFFDHREAAARALGLEISCFCAVIRPDDHPARPTGHRPLDAFWRGRGYEPMAGAIAEFEWREVGAEEETPHQLQYWWRRL
ncbi:MAG: GNAT family N-acetyltransferase [Pseudomonadota bacterium]